MSLLEASLLAAARQRPDAPLLHIGPRTLTGRDFEALVDSTAQQWQRQGLGAGTLIGWLGHNSPEMLAALLACARLGAVFVPLNWRLGLVARADRERYPVDQRLRFTDTAGRASSAYRAQTQEAARDEALTATPQWQWDAADGRLAQLNAVLSVSQYVGAGDDLRSELQGSPPRLQADRLAYQHQRGFGQMGFNAAWPLADGTRLGASLLASRGRRVQHSVLTGSDLGGAAVRDSAVQSTRIDDVISARGDLQRRLAAEHTVTAGLHLEGNRRQENRVQQERIASWAPDLTDEHYDAASSSLAAFVQDDWLASKATTLSAGIPAGCAARARQPPGWASALGFAPGGRPPARRQPLGLHRSLALAGGQRGPSAQRAPAGHGADPQPGPGRRLATGPGQPLARVGHRPGGARGAGQRRPPMAGRH